MANLSSKQIKSWKTKVDSDLNCIIKSFTKTTEQAKTLTKITKSADSTLSYRFNDLSKLTEEVTKKLSLFTDSFNNSIEDYIKSIELSEKKVTDLQRKSIDQFAEKAAEISKLTI